jgi:inhibitor of cysteine peptidase
VQKEIKKRTSLYGVIAILLAVMLTASIYNFGAIPGFGPSIQPAPTPQSEFLKAFSSYEELRSFLAKNSKIEGMFPFFGPWDSRNLPVVPLGPEVLTPYASTAHIEYSTTNVQVAGVDEADIVKTDGGHIYLISGNNVFILKAYPPEEAEVLSKITFNDTYPVGIFVNGDRLAVLGCTYIISSVVYYGYYYVDIKSSVNVYDISNRANPVLLENFTISGSYFNSRMIGDYVYFVVSQPAYVIYDTVVLPKIYSSDGITEINASEIHYYNASDDYYLYTTVVALNMQNTTEEPNHMTILMGKASTMYVSLSNIYITFPEPDGQTSIYRIRIENRTINCEARGKVSGRELNQFSMDEYDNYFRMATTTWTNGTSTTNLYVLNMSLNLVGSLESIAPNETMDSARFIGNRCYLSTSVVRRDPFFVIDVANVSEPKILGYLKIPGFTRYLHPYDENHVIGIGKDGNNVKITLFDVSNVSAPINITEYKIEGGWSDTTVLTDYKAFLFDKSKELLVLPATISCNDSLWQGAYVFNITLSNGLVLLGNVTHQESGVSGWDSSYWVNRALYIENTLYTVSDKKIKINRLEDLLLIKEIEFT